MMYSITGLRSWTLDLEVLMKELSMHRYRLGRLSPTPLSQAGCPIESAVF